MSESTIILKPTVSFIPFNDPEYPEAGKKVTPFLKNLEAAVREASTYLARVINMEFNLNTMTSYDVSINAKPIGGKLVINKQVFYGVRITFEAKSTYQTQSNREDDRSIPVQYTGYYQTIREFNLSDIPTDSMAVRHVAMEELFYLVENVNEPQRSHKGVSREST